MSNTTTNHQWACRAVAAVLALTAAFMLHAQDVTVTGTVSDAIGPVVGVGIIQKGTSNGVATDVDGKYSLTVPRGAILVFSSIGYVTQEIAADRAVIDVTLAEDSQLIEETVVIGYGVQRKSDVTGAISSVKSEDLENRTIASVDQGLQGKTAGVVVMMGSAAPGSSPTVRVRGFSSNSSSDPLYVVDGLRVSARDISGIDPSTIESMEILKDAASAAIYGAQAGNGVVLITTKQGKKGEAKISYEFQHTIQSLAYAPEVLHADDYITFYNEKYTDGTFANLVDTFYDGTTDTVWADEVYENSIMDKHTINFNGANDRGSFLVSLSYLSNDGIVKGESDVMERFALTFNADYRLNDWMKLSSRVSADRMKVNNSIRERNMVYGSFTSSVLMFDPLTPFYTPYDSVPSNSTLQKVLDMGYNVLGDENGYYSISEFFASPMPHPFVSRDSYENLTRMFQLRGNLALDMTPIKGLTLTSRLGYRANAVYSNAFEAKYYYSPEAQSSFNTVTSSESMMQYWQWENFANYAFSLGGHNFTAMAGVSADETITSSVDGSVNDILKEDPLYHYLDYQSSTATKTVGGDDLFRRDFSWFGRLNWDYKGKYMLQGTFRADAADLSILSKKARWGYFPAVSAGWEVAKEGFMDGARGWLSGLKVRASWGQNGSIAGLSDYMWRSGIASEGFYNLTSSTATSYDVTGMKPSTLGNEDLTWETSEQTDIGVDVRLWGGKVTFTADYYVKKTKDLIVSDAVPSLSVGNTASPINGGNVENRGFEFDASYRGQVGDFSYSVSGNMATLHNEVTYVSEYVSGRLSGASMNTYKDLTIFEAGYPVWYFNGWKATGINEATGYPEFEDLNGDGVISDSDKQFIGSAIPDFTYGLTLTAGWKNIDFLVFASGSHGNDVWQWLNKPDAPKSNILQSYFDNRWTPTHTDASYPSAATPSSEMAHYTYSSAMVKDGSYLKLKQIQLGYNVPAKILSKARLSALRVYVSLDDFFTFTDYDGYDPEATSASFSIMATGIDQGSYPTSRKAVFGINLTF